MKPRFKIGDKVDVADSVFWNYTAGGEIINIRIIGKEVSYLFTMEGKSGKYYQEEKYIRKMGDTQCYCEQCQERKNESLTHTVDI